MHIGVVSDTRYKTDHRIRNEVRYLTQLGHRVSVLNVKYDGSDDNEIIEDVQVYNISMSRKWQKTFRGLQNLLPTYEQFWGEKIKKFIETANPKVVHVHDLYMSKAAWMGTRYSNTPIVLDLHENYPIAIQSYTWANQFPKKILVQPHKWVKKEREYLGYADKLIVLSQNFKQILCKRYEFINPDDVYVYPNVPDTRELRSHPIQKYNIGKENDLVLFYFGGVAQRRGIHTVLEAMRILIPQGEHIHFLIIGPIDSADKNLFQGYFNDPVLRDHITFYPWKDISEFPSYAQASDIGISPLVKNDQHESGIANKVYQYMLFAKPVLVSNCKPQQDLIEEHECGWVFESENVHDLVKVLKSILRSTNLQEMGRNGQIAIETEENLENKGKVLQSLYDKISDKL